MSYYQDLKINNEFRLYVSNKINFLLNFLL